MVVTCNQVCNLFVMRFNFMVFYVKSRIEVMNNNLKYYVKLSKSDPSIDSSPQITTITKMHGLLTDAIDLINNSFSIDIILPLTFVMIGDVFSVYNYYLEYKYGTWNMFEVTLQFAWFFSTSFYVMCAINISGKSTHVGNHTLSIALLKECINK